MHARYNETQTYVAGTRGRNSRENFPQRSPKTWDPFGHAEGQFSPNVKKSEKSGSRGLPAPGGKKSGKS